MELLVHFKYIMLKLTCIWVWSGIPVSPDFSAVFAGNIVEWKYPRDVNLCEVEFKALASGSHTIMQDFMYVVISLFLLGEGRGSKFVHFPTGSPTISKYIS